MMAHRSQILLVLSLMLAAEFAVWVILIDVVASNMWAFGNTNLGKLVRIVSLMLYLVLGNR